jgi:tryptophanase
MVRLAIHRRVNANNPMDFTAALAGNIFESIDSLAHGVKIRREAHIMRHFKVELERL